MSCWIQLKRNGMGRSDAPGVTKQSGTIAKCNDQRGEPPQLACPLSPAPFCNILKVVRPSPNWVAEAAFGSTTVHTRQALALGKLGARSTEELMRQVDGS